MIAVTKPAASQMMLPRRAYDVDVLLRGESLQTTFRQHTVRMAVGSIGTTDSDILVVLNRVHRQSLEDLALVVTLSLEPYEAARQMSKQGQVSNL